ncbi:MAG: hypothetical protein C4521_12325 [Actinobacteria bacterium]|nr:MAG: hypothetical protein C4521_12325 [Actinomycetota bacterium]
MSERRRQTERDTRRSLTRHMLSGGTCDVLSELAPVVTRGPDTVDGFFADTHQPGSGNALGHTRDHRADHGGSGDVGEGTVDLSGKDLPNRSGGTFHGGEGGSPDGPLTRRPSDLLQPLGAEVFLECLTERSAFPDGTDDVRTLLEGTHACASTRRTDSTFKDPACTTSDGGCPESLSNPWGLSLQHTHADSTQSTGTGESGFAESHFGEYSPGNHADDKAAHLGQQFSDVGRRR